VSAEYAEEKSALQRATADGFPLKGHFHQSTMIEWNAGFGKRYGLVYVEDFKAQKRKPKLSASFFRETARRNAVR